MPRRAQRLLHLVRELHVVTARREAHRLQVEHAAAAAPALHNVAWKVELLRPIGGEDHAREMAARGVAGDEDAIRIAAKAHGVAVYPSDGAAHLLSHRQQTAAHVLHPGEVGYHAVCPSMQEQLGCKGVVLGETY